MKMIKGRAYGHGEKTFFPSRTREPVLRMPFLTVMGLFLLCCLFQLIVLTPVSKAESHGSTGGGAIAGICHVTVVEADSGDPIQDAFVMIGSKPGQPFADNYGVTDENGDITFTNAALVGAQTITAGKDRYRFFSFLEVNANVVEIPLERRSPAVDTSQVTGSLDNFVEVESNDSLLQAALVIPTLTLEDLMSLDFSALLSEEVPLEILGQTIDVPGNIVIPTQTEKVVIPIEISKPSYQLSLPTGTVQNLFSLGVQAPVGELTGGDSFDLFSVEPIRVGMARDVEITGNIVQDINMNKTLNDNLTLNTNNTPQGSEILLISAGEINGDAEVYPGGSGGLFLMDFDKKAGGSDTTSVLGTVDRTEPFSDTRYLAVAVCYAGEITELNNVTAIVDRGDSKDGFVPTTTRTLDTFFSPVQLNPVNGNRFTFSNATQAGISPQPDLNVALLSLVKTVDGETETEILWTLMGDGSKLGFNLPVLPPETAGILAVGASDQVVWTQLVFSLNLKPTAFDFNQYDMNDFAKYVTHLSANTLEFNADADGDGIHLFEDKCPTLNNTDYSGDVVSVKDVEFPSNCEIECVATQSMTIGPNVVVKSGAQVTFKSPVVEGGDGVRFEPGARIRITQP